VAGSILWGSHSMEIIDLTVPGLCGGTQGALTLLHAVDRSLYPVGIFV